jgi:hypothetical protein
MLAMVKQVKKKRGRPKGSVSCNPANKTLSNVRITETQFSDYKKAASTSGESFSAWVRDALDRAAKRSKS